MFEDNNKKTVVLPPAINKYLYKNFFRPKMMRLHTFYQVELLLPLSDFGINKMWFLGLIYLMRGNGKFSK